MTLVMPSCDKPAFPASQQSWGKVVDDPILAAKSGAYDKDYTTADLQKK